ncbi:MAG: hypothetical protein BJ554DRAFT_6724 [Olpidium bornovanus]|uniref:Ribosomal protein S19 n=1 Tax=Olpidium bornovanus TaxID=278681 RepID=A0A8H7ZXD5_9FUNG|nr:MAG: hypothetical protein BJ554DRAFT_6724 [Olpidium bornovanus]
MVRGRQVWKGPFFTSFPGLRKALETGTPIQTKQRSCSVIPSFIGVTFDVHNGRRYFPVKITEAMIGKKLGDFAPTKKPKAYTKGARS